MARTSQKMQCQVRKQPKWHELVSSVPSIPKKDKQVPEGDDYDQDKTASIAHPNQQ